MRFSPRSFVVTAMWLWMGMMSRRPAMAFATRRPFGVATTTTTARTYSATTALRRPSWNLRGGRSSTGTGGRMRAASTTATTTATTATDAAATTQDDTTMGAYYAELVERLQELTHLERVSAVLNYDQMVFLPAAAAGERGKQSAALATVLHAQATHPRIGELLDLLEQTKDDDDAATSVSDSVDAQQHRVIQLARKAYDAKVKIPSELAAQHARVSAEAYNCWTQARADNNFTAFAESLQQGIDVAKATARHLQTEADKAADKSLYATLLDAFECGMDVTRIDAVFTEIQDALVPLIARVLGSNDASTTPPDTRPLTTGTFPLAQQEALSRHLVTAIGYDPTRGRIDVSVHPFSSGMSRHDVRITSRFRPEEWYQGLAGSMHEAGHAIYEQNMGPQKTSNSDSSDSALPIDAALSMGMHESQSLFWERHVGLSRSFWTYATPIVHEYLGAQLGDYSSEQLFAAVNAAQRSLIRVEADELTYPLHVILRYQLEKDFIEGRLDVKDIPMKWNEGMKDMLDIDVPNDAQGCLQDVHWSMLAYGYFPTYLIGAAAAAQLAHYCQQDIPDFDAKIAAGEFQEIKAWMTEKVHRHGSRYTSLDAHFEAQLGEPLNPKYFIDYLTKKYTELYKC